MPVARKSPIGGKSSQTELSVLKLIHAHPAISRVELSELSGFSSASITGIVNSLATRGLLVEEASSSRTIGRKRISLRLSQSLGYVVGVDLGTFHLRIAVTDLNGDLIVSKEQRTEMWQGRETVLQRSFALLDQVLAEAGVPLKKVVAIGVAFSGVIDTERGYVLSYPRLGQVEQWKNVPLREIVEERFGVPCQLEDSARAVATSEKEFGAGQKLSDFVYVDAGMGIGASLFINGTIYRGFHGSAGEFGHMTVDENGPLCCCGSNGCLEAMASASTIMEAVRTAIAKGVGSKTLEMAGGDPQKISIEIISQAARENDSLAYRALSEAASHVGAAAADLVNLLNPQAIIFGGALFRAAPELLLEQIRRVVRQRAMEKAANDACLMVSPLGSDAGARGVARLAAADRIEALYLKAIRS
ncbi:MAG TPA: ROK family transcriptional regulator [Granulicella sp.]